jgi:uncharacterized protein (DUF362 family)
VATYSEQSPRVAVARTHEKHRSASRVTQLVREALELLGGMSAFVKTGDVVLIKPNQTVFYSAEEGCTTDPLVVGALIRLAREAGAARVVVGESSGGFFSSIECMRITGVAAVAEREGAQIVDLGSDETTNRIVPVPNGEVIDHVPLPVPLLEADVVIDAPKAKTHHIEPISGALKNWVGAVNRTWRQSNHGDADMIKRFMDIMTVCRPDLCVVDALICGEGDGPIANLPCWGGCILASEDPVATDVSIARLMKKDWRQLRFAREAERRGLGRSQPIEYLGTNIDEAAIDAWHGHEGFDYLPPNFLVGGGVTLEGTIGHVKSVLDSMLRRGQLNDVIWMRGTPTIMVGETDDPNFEQHLQEGPYVVFDDAAKPKYKNDPRVCFVPGHPVLRNAMPELMKGLGVSIPGNAAMKWGQFKRWSKHNIEYGTPVQTGLTLLAPLLALGAAAAITGILMTRTRLGST